MLRTAYCKRVKLDFMTFEDLKKFIKDYANKGSVKLDIFEKTIHIILSKVRPYTDSNRILYNVKTKDGEKNMTKNDVLIIEEEELYVMNIIDFRNLFKCDGDIKNQTHYEIQSKYKSCFWSSILELSPSNGFRYTSLEKAIKMLNKLRAEAPNGIMFFEYRIIKIEVIDCEGEI